MILSYADPRGLALSVRAICFERHAGRIIELGDELVEQTDEFGSLLRREYGKDMRLRALGGLAQAIQHALARLGQRQRAPPFVVGADAAADEARRLQLV